MLLVPPLSSPGSGRRASGARAQCRRGNAACAIVRRCTRGDRGSIVVLVIEGMSRMAAGGAAWVGMSVHMRSSGHFPLLLAASNSRQQGTGNTAPADKSAPNTPIECRPNWRIRFSNCPRSRRFPPRPWIDAIVPHDPRRPSSRSIPPPKRRRRRGAEQGLGAARPFEVPSAAPHRRRRRRATVHACVDVFVLWDVGSAALGRRVVGVRGIAPQEAVVRFGFGMMGELVGTHYRSVKSSHSKNDMGRARTQGACAFGFVVAGHIFIGTQPWPQSS